MSGALLDLYVGARILTAQGMGVVSAVERHGVLLKDASGTERSVPFTQLSGRSATAAGVEAVHASLLPWLDSLDEATVAEARFKHEVCTEVATGYRYGLPELAQPGEPFYPFGPTFGASVSARIRAMSRLISYERTVDRIITRRVYEGQIKSGRVAPRTIHDWYRAYERDPWRGLVDGRKVRGKQGFEVLDPTFRRIAEDLFAQFDGTVSAVNMQEIERRIRLQLKNEGVEDPNLPDRLVQEYLSYHYRALGGTTRAHKSRRLRKVAGHESYPAQHPGETSVDLTRWDAFCVDELHERAISVEVGTLISIPTRVVLACRVYPRSATGVEAGLLVYDAMRQLSMVVEGTTIDDFRWAGMPSSLDLSGNPLRWGRRSLAADASTVQGEHQLPGVAPTSLRSDHGSIFVSEHFQTLCAEFGINLMLSRPKKPNDNAHVERLHETYQRAAQQIPGFKGRAVHERGTFVTDQPLLTVEEFTRHLHRFIALDYHRQPHDGLTLPGAPGIRLTPLEMHDALAEATGRLTVPQHPDLIYQFLPIRWLRPGHAGVEYKNLTYDDEVLEDFRSVRTGRFRQKDNAVPFHYDPRDVTRLWFRHPDTDRIHEIGWRGRHLIHAPLVDVVRDRALARIKERGGNRVLNKTTIMRQIIDEIGELTTAPDSEELRTKLSAARIRWEQAQKDHDEVVQAHRLLEQQAASGLPHIPKHQRPDALRDDEVVLDFEEPWPDYQELG
ncbi:hypothetical protein [Ornithinimicrobium panacihumi]|uniref:hypothetical protein n=1 Tax=Ornithinimicrobium panacihumi TaxID=2008449 RepID=UPI003F89DDDF